MKENNENKFTTTNDNMEKGYVLSDLDKLDSLFYLDLHNEAINKQVFTSHLQINDDRTVEGSDIEEFKTLFSNLSNLPSAHYIDGMGYSLAFWIALHNEASKKF